MQKLVDKLANPEFNWKEYLIKYISNQIPYDYTYSRPHKKSIACGFYMPNVMKERLEIVASIDTSGSISQKDIGEFLAELHSITKLSSSIEVTVVIVDAQIHEVHKLTDDNVENIISMKMSGGGGTNHIPLFKWVEKEKPDCKILVNFTDGYTSFPNTPPPYDTIWVLCHDGCNDDNIPFGTVLRRGVDSEDDDFNV